MNNIAHVFLQSCFQVSKERYVFKEHSRIRLATKYIHPYTCTSWFDCMTQLSLDPLFDFTIFVLKVCSSFLHTYELHISLSGRKRKGITSLLPWWGSTNIYWGAWECHTMESLSFILKTYKNSRIMVGRRTWDIVLDLIVLSFNYSRPKWRLQAP